MRESTPHERRLARITNALPMMVAYVDRDERYRFVNDRYEEAWNLPRAAILGKRLVDLVGAEVYAQLESYVEEALAGEHVEFEVDLPVGGESRRTLVNYVPYLDEGTVQGFYVTAADITHRHQTAIALERARQVEARASEAKSQFLANISHEIRTPLTAILGFTDLLASEVKGADAERFLATIRRNGRHLLSIVDDVLDLSSIEAGNMEARRERFSLSEVVWDVFESFQLHAVDKDLTYRLELPRALPEPNIGDPLRIRQVLYNLLNNAFKFTSEGEITLRLEWHEATSEVVLIVADNGIGFPTEAARQLFEPFHQHDSSGTRRHQGSGLGLAISERLAKLLGGELEANSQPGVGSTFTFRLPLNLALGAEMTSTERRHGRVSVPESRRLRGRVMVVDDNDDIRELVAVQLRDAGALTVEARSAREAFSLIEEHAPDLILMDVQMPEMDGLAATRKLRDEGFDRPVVALTARALRQDRKECLEAGCDDFLPKPIHFGDLERTLARLLDIKPGEITTPRRALVVEDDEDNAELLKLGLEAKGWQTRVASSVEEALDAVAEDQPDVVISDLNLGPQESGLDLARQLSTADDAPRLIALSGAADMEQRALDGGFDGFALKPCSIQQLLTLVAS